MWTILKLIVLCVLVVIGAGFAVINVAPVMVDLYFWRPELPLSLLLLFAVGVGIILGAFVSAFYFMRIKKENADLRRKSRLAREEVQNLRSMPIKGH